MKRQAQSKPVQTRISGYIVDPAYGLELFKKRWYTFGSVADLICPPTYHESILGFVNARLPVDVSELRCLTPTMVFDFINKRLPVTEDDKEMLIYFDQELRRTPDRVLTNMHDFLSWLWIINRGFAHEVYGRNIFCTIKYTDIEGNCYVIRTQTDKQYYHCTDKSWVTVRWFLFEEMCRKISIPLTPINLLELLKDD